MSEYLQIHNKSDLNHDDTKNIPNNSTSYYTFPYKLDKFQLDGCKAIESNENILVTAHTGSGKTVLALYGIAKTLSENKKVIYTSPIKTLSNQKYAEFSDQLFKLGQFENKTIGIMTGDIKINPLGDLLIMTAEILRNSLLRKYDEEIYEWSFNPNDIGCVVLDEVHFINNPERGKVWEEIIINLPSHIQLVMLSATITGAEEMVKWVTNLKNIPCRLMTTNKRPVPLKHGIWFQKHQKDNEGIPTEGKINYFLHGDHDWKEGVWTECHRDITKYYTKYQFSIETFFNCIKHLFDTDMTPCNVFLLNRSLLEQYAKKLPFNFSTFEEQAIIRKIWNKHLLKYAILYDSSEEWIKLLELVEKGIGIHHSGMIPILKEVVEILYSQGLIKVLLATETFAMGVNMPTKTVVFCQLTKFDGNKSHRNLRPEEYGQMAGRAGRRGKDLVGNIVILPSLSFMNESDAKSMIMVSPQKISSKFSIDPIYIIKQISYLLEQSSDINFDIINGKIISNCKNSLFHLQDSLKIESIQREYNELSIKMTDMSKTFNIKPEYIEIYGKIQDIDRRLKPYSAIFKIAPKVEKKLLKEKSDLTVQIDSKIFQHIEKYNIVKNQLDTLEINLDIGHNKIKNQIELILSYLTEFEYITPDYKLSKIGKIISEINECNPFLLGCLINDEQLNYFDDLSFSELVGVLSIFISDNKSKEDIYIDDLICDKKCKDILHNLLNYIDIYQEKETILNNKLPYPSWLDWSLDLSSFNSVESWAKGLTWGHISTQYSSFQGNFIKTILRINNLMKNIESIAKIFNNVKLLNTIDGYQEKLIRDIVITDSLYLSSA